MTKKETLKFIVQMIASIATASLRHDFFSCYMAPMHDVAPSAVTIAVAIDAIICTINFNVSFLVIILMFHWLIIWHGLHGSLF